jgi:hypothetical protein
MSEHISLAAIQEAVVRLSKLTPIELDRALRIEAEKLGCSAED